MDKIFCYLHPSKPAETTCSRCKKPLCSACSTFYYGLGRHFCPLCLRTIQRNRTILKACISVLACGLLGLGIYYISVRPAGLGTLPNRTAGARIDPSMIVGDCDRNKIVERAEAKFRAGEPQQAIDLCDTFFNKCGEHLRLRWITYEAYKQLSQWDKAIGEVDRLIADDPYDKDYRCWRGIALERKGDFEGAIQDYRQALALAPSLGRIPFNIANLLERVGKPCEAIFPVEQYLFYHPKDRNDPAIQRRFVTIHQNGSCQGYTSGPDQTVVRFQPGSGAVPCEVRVNGVVSGRFVVDTGASYTTLSRKFAERLGIYQLPSAAIIVQTAAGISSARLTTVDLVDVGGVKASRVNVAIIDGLPDDLDGLLGLSFLSRFEIHLDSVKGTMKIVRPN